MRAFAPLLAILLLAACATTTSTVDEAREHYAAGRGEEALAVLQKAAAARPDDPRLRGEYFRMRERVVAQWAGQAAALRSGGHFEAAESLYRRVLEHDPQNSRATTGLGQLAADNSHRAVVAQAEQLARAGKYREAQVLLRPVLTENPEQRGARRLQRVIDEKLAPPAVSRIVLKPTNDRPISLDLHEITVRNVFELLQRASGISFLFDRDVRTDQRTSIALRNADIGEAIGLALLTNQLEQKVLNESTVFVFPSTPQKLREHQELVVKAFYVANADVRQTANMIRTLVKTRDIFIDEKIGLLAIKDTPAAVRLAERLIAAQDLAEPEVMLEVEVLEVSRSRLLELGLRYPDSVAWSLVGAGGTAGTVTLPEWLNRDSRLAQLSFTNPLFLLSLRQQDNATTVLANPRIRVKNKEKARIHIGDRVPVITTTAAATGSFVSESISYLDVGLKLEVEPVISLDDDVGIKVGLEVSSITSEVTGAGSSTLAYQIGTRNAATHLRLHDGETQVLAGLISDEDRRVADRVPGLGDLPVAGRLFSSTRDNTGRTEIVLLITPRIVRSLVRPEASALEFSAGTEASTGARPPAPVPPPAQPQAPRAEPGEAPAQPTAPQLVPFGGIKPPGS
jgi:general secretion pathway protein D